MPNSLKNILTAGPQLSGSLQEISGDVGREERNQARSLRLIHPRLVVHAKFGQGVIVSAEGQGPDARVQINFGRQGMKWLALEYAKLSAA